VDRKLLTPDDVAGRWGVHRATVLRLFHAGILPGVILCRGEKRTTIRFRLEAIEEFEKKREQKRSRSGREAESGGRDAL